MKTIKLWRIAFVILAAFSLTSCSSDEPRYADPEAHEKTVQLNEQYGPLMVGTWHYEKIQVQQANGVVYNLAGQHVANDFKGLVIKNGKKMIQK